jgi:hypothetical protein
MIVISRSAALFELVRLSVIDACQGSTCLVVKDAQYNELRNVFGHEDGSVSDEE